MTNKCLFSNCDNIVSNDKIICDSCQSYIDKITENMEPVLYRLYDENGIYLRCCTAKGYEKALELLNPSDTDKIFCVQEDNHEVECGKAWRDDLLDNPDENY